MTIEVLGEFVMPIVDLKLDDVEAFKVRMTKDNVKDMAGSIDEVGLLHLPMVRRSDGLFIFGEDRLAAHCILERDDILCRLVECSDDDVVKLREAENKHRRNDTAAELLARVEAAEADARGWQSEYERKGSKEELREALLGNAFVDPNSDDDWFGAPDHGVDADAVSTSDLAAVDALAPELAPKRKGRPKKQRTEAVERVAAETGRTAEAVRKATEREAKRRDLSVIETWGREQPEPWLEPVLEARASFTDAAGKVQAAMAALTRLGTASQLRDGVLAAQYGALRLAAQQLRMARPAAVCAWCKNLPGAVNDCKACRGLGYITEEELGLVPDKLRDPRMVSVGGNLRALMEHTKAMGEAMLAAQGDKPLPGWAASAPEWHLSPEAAERVVFDAGVLAPKTVHYVDAYATPLVSTPVTFAPATEESVADDLADLEGLFE